MLRETMRIAVVLLALAGVAAAQLANPSFEEGLDGWEIATGAQTGGGPASRAEIDGEVARAGKSSLRLTADRATGRFLMALQTLPCRPGDRVLFTVAGRCRGLRREGRQYVNANALLLFADAHGNRIDLLTSPMLEDDREWIDLTVHAFVPAGAAKVQAGVFCSLSGTAWFDDARLRMAPADPADADARALAYDALRIHLDRTYPYWDLQGKPAPADLRADPADADVASVLHGMLAPLKDIHLWVEMPLGNVYTVVGNPRKPNWNDAAIRKRLTATVLDAPPHLVGRIGDVGYARIGAFAADGFDALEAALEKLADARALVLDVRPNGGGDERLAWRIAGRFAAGPVAYGLVEARDPTILRLDAFRGAEAKILRPPAGREPDEHPVAVLQGPYCVSSTEWFLLMMRELDHVTTVGLRSRGATGNPRPFPLFEGVVVHVPTQRGLTISGELIEGKGIAPDVEVEQAGAEGDAALEKALEILR